VVDLAWQADAACAGTDDPRFIGDAYADLAAAATICRDCPVKRDCLQYAVDTRSWGTWGAHVLADGRVVRPRR
jgi:WhiB family redox-sensing transcriptional regulator